MKEKFTHLKCTFCGAMLPLSTSWRREVRFHFSRYHKDINIISAIYLKPKYFTKINHNTNGN